MYLFNGIEYEILKAFFPGERVRSSESDIASRSRAVELLGPDLIARVQGKVVIDFGCGAGADSVQLARSGAARVIGIDIRPSILKEAADLAVRNGVANRCQFVTDISQANIAHADVVVSIDAFEHFSDPAGVLRTMFDLLKPGGDILISFGPTWFHPLGGHLPRPVFPWAHLLFTESAIMRWRSDFKSDGAHRYSEVEGGLNQMNINRFESLVESSPFRVLSIECVPIRPLRRLHTKYTREWTTAVVRAHLQKP